MININVSRFFFWVGQCFTLLLHFMKVKLRIEDDKTVSLLFKSSQEFLVHKHKLTAKLFIILFTDSPLTL